MNRRPRNNRNRNRPQKGSDLVRQDFLFTRSVAWSASTSATYLTLEGSALAAVSGTIAAFMDMYRFYRILDCRVKTVAATVTTAGPPYVLTWAPEGTTIPPTIAAVENLSTSEITVNEGTGAFHTAATLVLHEDTLRSVTGGRWLVTSADATDTFLESYGAIAMIADSSTSTSIIGKVTLCMEFKEIVDPNTISITRKPKPPNPRVAHPEDCRCEHCHVLRLAQRRRASTPIEYSQV